MAVRILIASIAGAVLTGLVGSAAMFHRTEQTSPPPQDYNSGAYLYRAFCASCHGETGKGDGPVADLSTPPASDITTLQRKAGGTFPRARVMGILDGSVPLRGHDGPAAMPDWPNVLRKTEGDDARIIRQRLEALVSHVEALQVK